MPKIFACEADRRRKHKKSHCKWYFAVKIDICVYFVVCKPMLNISSGMGGEELHLNQLNKKSVDVHC